MKDRRSPRASSRKWTPARYRALLRSRGPQSVRFRTRLAVLLGAVVIGLAATVFALAADAAGAMFERYVGRYLMRHC
jgi:hypothetical protein